MIISRFALGLVTLAAIASVASAADLTIKSVDKEPPKEFNASISKTLQSKAVQVLEGDKAVYELWFRAPIPLKAAPESPAKALDCIDEITLLGVAVVGEGRRDYKDNEIQPGTYAIRFGLQPQDGDHLGTSEFPYFAVLVPAKSDAEMDSIKTYKAMVKSSGKSTATGHPAVLVMRPVSTQADGAPELTSPAPELKAIKTKLPAQPPSTDKPVSISFELVVQGKYKS